ncbi:hypothetical protein KIN20_038402 [Parelaphostrongylus tenuis]|uniref:C2H2-type domain-containing protein n=1 Tax=Parelaphostrongylus tenuis TaxID=148309 RepID=A0AAD5QR37_PARTN|nr:hypothetical protein KIN20_038402 [Parelaphostrongylus tenuis]
MTHELECGTHKTRPIPHEYKFSEELKSGQTLTVKEAIGRSLLTVKEETGEDLLTVKREPSEDLNTVKGETVEDSINFATNWHHTSAHFSGNDVPLHVNWSFDKERVLRTLEAADVCLEKIHEEPCVTTTEKMSVKREIRAIFLREFKIGSSAAETSRKISELFGPTFANERTVQRWFSKFRKGDESLEDEDERSDRPREVDNDQMPAECVMCGERFKLSSQLWEHFYRKHLKEGKRICGECGQKFVSRSGLKRHVQRVHENIVHMCPCKGCEHPGFKCEKALAVHVRTVHRNIRAYACETCGMAFYERSELKMHRLTHIYKKVYQCECGSTFSYKAGLETHQRLCLLN